MIPSELQTAFEARIQAVIPSALQTVESRNVIRQIVTDTISELFGGPVKPVASAPTSAPPAPRRGPGRPSTGASGNAVYQNISRAAARVEAAFREIGLELNRKTEIIPLIHQVQKEHPEMTAVPLGDAVIAKLRSRLKLESSSAAQPPAPQPAVAAAESTPVTQVKSISLGESDPAVPV